MNPYTGEIVEIENGKKIPDGYEPIPSHEFEGVKRMSFKERMRWLMRKSLEK